MTTAAVVTAAPRPRILEVHCLHVRRPLDPPLGSLCLPRTIQGRFASRPLLLDHTSSLQCLFLSLVPLRPPFGCGCTAGHEDTISLVLFHVIGLHAPRQWHHMPKCTFSICMGWDQKTPLAVVQWCFHPPQKWCTRLLFPGERADPNDTETKPMNQNQLKKNPRNN
jgi:hypothetical protein